MRRLVSIIVLAGCSGPAATETDAAIRDAVATSDGNGADGVTADADVPGNFTDGVCNAPSVKTGVLDPDCVYLIGTLLPGSAGRDVLMYLGTPTDYSYGFGYYADRGTIRHTDGKLLFTDSDGGDKAFAWQPDATPGTSPVDPHTMLGNDTVIATPGCTHGTYKVDVFPDDGVAAYRCYRTTDEPASDGNRLFLEGQSSVFVAGNDQSPVALGAGRAVLLAGMNTLAVAADGQLHAVSAGAFAQVVAARWSNNKFLVALVRSYMPVSVDLVTIARGGDLAMLGTYQLGSVTSYWDQCKVEHGGGLVCFAYEGSTDVVVRYSTTAAPTKIYDESMHPVQIHISSLATGA